MALLKKFLGQHWLTDEKALSYIVDAAELVPNETVLEIGPGTGTLTKKLLERGVRVIAVEKDEELARKLSTISSLHTQPLEVITGDILQFDLTSMPASYKVVANIPYYLTSNLLRVLTESSNPPELMTLLVQKEVAERICAKPGQMSVLSVSAQLDYECGLGRVVPAKLFMPPPKVDSQVIILHRRTKPLFADLNRPKFFRLVKAGFSEKRKKLRSSLSGGLHIPKEQADQLLNKAGIRGDLRAQELSLSDWFKIYNALP